MFIRSFTKFFSEISKAMHDVRLLNSKYYWLTFGLGIVELAVGVVIMFGVSNCIAAFLGLEISECLRCQENGTAWFILFILALPFVFYVGMLIVLGMFSFSMYISKNFTYEQALAYTLYSRFPEHWLTRDE